MATWNAAFNASPAGGDNPKFGDDKIRELKTTLVDRWIKEHHFDINEGGAQPRQGLHKAGSAVAFYQDTAPTQRNGVALATMDSGLIWITSAGQKFFWSGSAWIFFGDYNTHVEITSGSGDWTVPDGVFRLRVKCVGGGGGGGGGTGRLSGGGGGGGTLIGNIPWSYITTTPGSDIAYTVGAGGSGGAENTNGGAGGATTFAGALSGGGGGGGRRGADFSGDNGGAGSAPTAASGYNGAYAGAAGSVGNSQYRALGDSSASESTGGSGGGAGGRGGIPNGTGATGAKGGGGGGGSCSISTGYAGGAGGPGIIIIEY